MMAPEPDTSPQVPPSAETLRVLVENHRKFLAFLERRVESRALAEDILQEAFVRGMDKLGSLREGESAVAWFYRLLRNAVIDQRRRARAAGRRLDSFAAEIESSAEAPSDTAGAICRCVAELADNLKPEYREALLRVDVEGLPVKDFAEQSGISSSNAGVRLFRAREALRKQLRRSCGTCAEHGCFDCSCGVAKAGCCATTPADAHEP
jgi:RNA polymerase sigma-70 factor (ECF subfamily)